MMKRLAIFGAESIFTADLVETAERLGYVIDPAVVDGPLEWDMTGLKPRPVAECAPDDIHIPCGIPWVTPGLKWQKAQAAIGFGFHDFPNLVDPHASCARSATLERGVFQGAGATVGAFAVIEEFALLNRNASLGHHSRLGSYASLGPGAVVAARCHIGVGTMIGAGAVITPGISIGANCLVAAGSVVSRDMPDRIMCAGNPARVIQTGFPGYKDALVPV